MYGYIYKTINLLNGKIYIGQHKSEIFDYSYYGSGKLFSSVFKKYGKNNFKCELLEWCHSKEELNEREIYYIEKYNAKDSNIGYNLADGGNCWNCNYHQGMLGKHQSEKQKQIAREINSHPLSPEIKKKMSESAKKRTKNRITINDKYFIHKGDKQTCIDKNELEKYLLEGWIKGKIPMSTEDKELIKTKYKNSVYMNKDGKDILVNKNDIDKYLIQGYNLGKTKYSEERRKNISKSKKGKIAITNFKCTKYIEEKDFPKYETLGYIRGNLENIKRHNAAQIKRTQGELLETPSIDIQDNQQPS